MQHRGESPLDAVNVQAWADMTLDRLLDATGDNWHLTRRIVDACSAGLYECASKSEHAATMDRLAVMGTRLWTVMQDRSLRRDVDVLPHAILPHVADNRAEDFLWSECTIRLIQQATGNDIWPTLLVINRLTVALRDTMRVYVQQEASSLDARYVMYLADALQAGRYGMLFWGC